MNFKAVLLGCTLLAPGMALAEDVTVQVWGSTWKSLLEPLSQRFEAETGIKVEVVTQSSSGEGLVKLQAERANPTVDVWFTTNSVAAKASKDQELFTKIPAAEVPNTAGLLPGAFNEDWVAMYYYPMGIIYDVDAVPAEPTSWEDLWKPEYAGSIIAPSMSIYQGSLLLVANELNGGAIDNVDPGFEALEKLNPNVSLYYTSDSQARQSVAQGEGSILIGQSAHFRRLKDEGLNVKMIAPKPAPMYFDVMMMVNGDNQANAAKFINFVVSEQEQQILADAEYMTPVHAGVKVPASLADIMPAEGAGIVFDDQKIAEEIADWNARFESIATR
ncbi:extracellular solute-binding protein [Seohaeicola zhoushanensis]|uniref:ABC transporter substrate-binding protein n=1 Tax=Seohaeicola zhoushanensis TaxID=1569283 RepID=A0A8J3H0P5_9RHOB|nr:extracellular solute-binding protein [Seohaeicola zhoushanensis]GHF68877.1 ABC transporter substrate-binding protein [Seohaeicola zhoushanensis]